MRRAVLIACALLTGCATLQDVRPWAGIELWDESTRAAMPRWQDAGRVWVGVKANF